MLVGIECYFFDRMLHSSAKILFCSYFVLFKSLPMILHFFWSFLVSFIMCHWQGLVRFLFVYVCTRVFELSHPCFHPFKGNELEEFFYLKWCFEKELFIWSRHLELSLVFQFTFYLNPWSKGKFLTLELLVCENMTW